MDLFDSIDQDGPDKAKRASPEKTASQASQDSQDSQGSQASQASQDSQGSPDSQVAQGSQVSPGGQANPPDLGENPNQAAQAAQAEGPFGFEPRLVYREKSDKPSLSGRPVRLLHASDWHLGRTLNRVRRRHEEQEKFLAWLARLVEEAKIDVLVVAGDVFDSPSPPVAAQKLYFDFLVQVRKTACRDVVVVAGNHDSAAFLSAPAQFLKSQRIHVVGDPEGPERETLALAGEDGQAALIVAAVPFLKDRFVRVSAEGQDAQGRAERQRAGVAHEHLRRVAVVP
jgi:predicted phosphodiesterase